MSSNVKVAVIGALGAIIVAVITGLFSIGGDKKPLSEAGSPNVSQQSTGNNSPNVFGVKGEVSIKVEETDKE